MRYAPRVKFPRRVPLDDHANVDAAEEEVAALRAMQDAALAQMDDSTYRKCKARLNVLYEWTPLATSLRDKVLAGAFDASTAVAHYLAFSVWNVAVGMPLFVEGVVSPTKRVRELSWRHVTSDAAAFRDALAKALSANKVPVRKLAAEHAAKASPEMRPLLEEALRKERSKAVAELLRSALAARDSSPKDELSLAQAIQGGQDLEAALARADDINALVEGVAPLHLAIVYAPWFVAALLERGADPRLTTTREIAVPVVGSRSPRRYSTATLTFAPGTSPSALLTRLIARLRALRALYDPFANAQDRELGKRTLHHLSEVASHFEARGLASDLVDDAYERAQVAALAKACGKTGALPEGRAETRLDRWRLLTQGMTELFGQVRDSGWQAGLFRAPSETVDDEFLPPAGRKLLRAGQLLWVIDADAWVVVEGSIHRVHPEGAERVGAWSTCVNEWIRELGGTPPADLSSADRSPRAGSLRGVTFCLAGTFAPQEVDEVECLLRRQGATARKTVTKTVDVLIAGEQPEAKHRRSAEAQNVRVIDRVALAKLLDGDVSVVRDP